MPATPVPPGRFTTGTFTPMYCFAFFTSVRPRASVPPPAAHGTINVMSRSGNPAARAEVAELPTNADVKSADETKVRRVMVIAFPSQDLDRPSPRADRLCCLYRIADSYPGY